MDYSEMTTEALIACGQAATAELPRQQLVELAIALVNRICDTDIDID